ncbi:MAG: hypothetical protein M1816_007211 [Peltula sp. TS41687]|nr:MAG: hypothetical protein M1816_007211 [Peltula sp. TS41687]
MPKDHAKPSDRTKKRRAPLDGKGEFWRGSLLAKILLIKNREATSRNREAKTRSQKRPFEEHAQYRKEARRGLPVGQRRILGKGMSASTLATMKLTLTQFSQHQTAAAPVNDRKRKRQPEPEDHLRSVVAKKTPQAAPARSEDGTSGVKGASPAIEEIDPIDYWRKQGSWPKKYFEQDEDTQAYLTRDPDEESWVENFLIPTREYMERMDDPAGEEGVERMRALLARPKPPTLRRNQSSSGSLAQGTTTPSNQKPRETKGAEYKDLRYEMELAKKGNSFIDEDREGPKGDSKDACRKLLEASQDVPERSRFSDRVFKSTCRRLRNRNEAKVIDKIARLIVPSAEDHADFGAEHLEKLVETVNEGWENSIPVTKTRPQPDYAVGFDRSAFTEEQLNKLQPWVGELTETSFFMATYYMYFPFLTCEVKCGAAALDVADRQNAHSMTLAVRAIVELFRLVKREKELDREILAFSVSHDHRSVRIYSHYPVINGKDTKYYRHPIREFSFTELDGKEKWTTYQFTKNVYDRWMPGHLGRILSAIDEIPPGVNFELSQSASFSQEPQTRASQQSVSSATTLGEDNSQPSLVGSQDVTPNTSFTDQQFKKPRNKRAAEELH